MLFHWPINCVNFVFYAQRTLTMCIFMKYITPEYCVLRKGLQNCSTINVTWKKHPKKSKIYFDGGKKSLSQNRIRQYLCFLCARAAMVATVLHFWPPSIPIIRCALKKNTGATLIHDEHRRLHATPPLFLPPIV